MLLLTETTKYSFLFKAYRNKEFVKEFTISKKEIVTSSELPGLKDKHLNIVLNRLSGRVLLESNKAIMINGVECRRKILKTGDTLQIGPYRLVYKGETSLEQTADTTLNKRVTGHPQKTGKKELLSKKKTNRHPFAIFAEAAIVLFSLFFLWVCATQKHVEKLAEVKPPGTTISNHETLPPKDKGRGKENLKPEIKKRKSLKMPEGQLAIYAPNDVINPEKLDILFIHAHPDDETLDYGLSISRAVENGLNVGVLTFTDGESGFDFYPDREITDMYPDRELHGKELAKVRVKEEANSLKVLGAHLYIRLGLRNRPYTKEEVNKSLSTLVQEWGGKKFLVEKLVNIFTILSPDIIISPDGPSKAREHFEHEAVGYISNLAVNAYLNDYPDRLKAYLKLVDVQQTNAYPDKILMTVKAGIDKSDEYKKKEDALTLYQTQADACYYGIRRLEKFPLEYYFFQYKSSDKLAAKLFRSSTREADATKS